MATKKTEVETVKITDPAIIAELEAAKEAIREQLEAAKAEAKAIIDEAKNEAAKIINKNSEPEETIQERQAKIELVPFMAFKDGDNYKDDIHVIVNGIAYTIQRGVQVMIPKNVYEVLMQSQEQENAANDYMNAQMDAYKEQTNALKL